MQVFFRLIKHKTIIQGKGPYHHLTYVFYRYNTIHEKSLKEATHMIKFYLDKQNEPNEYCT